MLAGIFQIGPTSGDIIFFRKILLYFSHFPSMPSEPWFKGCPASWGYPVYDPNQWTHSISDRAWVLNHMQTKDFIEMERLFSGKQFW